MIVLRHLFHGSLLLAAGLSGCGPLTSGSDLISNNAGTIVTTVPGTVTE